MLTAETRSVPRYRCTEQQRGSYRKTGNNRTLPRPFYREAGRRDRLLDPSIGVGGRQSRPGSNQPGKKLTIILFDAGVASGRQ